VRPAAPETWHGATVFNESPRPGQGLAHAGCEWLASWSISTARVEGHPVNRAAVQEILKAVEVADAIGRRIRTIENISRWFERA